MPLLQQCQQFYSKKLMSNICLCTWKNCSHFQVFSKYNNFLLFFFDKVRQGLLHMVSASAWFHLRDTLSTYSVMQKCNAQRLPGLEIWRDKLKNTTAIKVTSAQMTLLQEQIINVKAKQKTIFDGDPESPTWNVVFLSRTVSTEFT